jgi:hypothetical protein
MSPAQFRRGTHLSGDGRQNEAVTLMPLAADLEDAIVKDIAMENRLSPMREIPRELLLEADELAQAMEKFERSLDTGSNRYRSIAGMLKAAEQLGD